MNFDGWRKVGLEPTTSSLSPLREVFYPSRQSLYLCLQCRLDFGDYSVPVPICRDWVTTVFCPIDYGAKASFLAVARRLPGIICNFCLEQEEQPCSLSYFLMLAFLTEPAGIAGLIGQHSPCAPAGASATYYLFHFRSPSFLFSFICVSANQSSNDFKLWLAERKFSQRTTIPNYSKYIIAYSFKFVKPSVASSRNRRSVSHLNEYDRTN